MTEVSSNPGRILNALAPRRAALSAADNSDLATFKEAHGAAYSCENLSYLKIRGIFNTVSKNAVVRVLFFSDDTLDLKVDQAEEITLTATSERDEADEYCSESFRVPTEGHAAFRLRLISISGGEVDLYALGVQ